MTQQELCQKAGLSYSTLTKIERGAIKSPSIFTIQAIAQALSMTMDELLQGNANHQQKYRSKSGVTFVYFDINGCLVHFFQRAFTSLSAESGVPLDRIESLFWRYNDRICRGKMTMSEFNNLTATELRLPKVDWTELYLEAIEPVTETYQLLEWVAEHYRVGLLTNIMPGLVKTMLERGYLPQVAYDAVVDSSEVKAIKPEAKIYEIATAKAHCPASEILLIDDTRPNLMAAEKHGWHVLWFDDYRAAESVARIRTSLELES